MITDLQNDRKGALNSFANFDNDTAKPVTVKVIHKNPWKMSDVEEKTIADELVVTKYKTAGDIVNSKCAKRNGVEGIEVGLREISEKPH